mmetsp:Transcript_163833/g.525479  ORF Transcript_163833/g.525479 Transcript_163833/m.525479 type:complete len:216 (-) Transcript_163833:649-1296(-)
MTKIGSNCAGTRRCSSKHCSVTVCSSSRTSRIWITSGIRPMSTHGSSCCSMLRWVGPWTSARTCFVSLPTKVLTRQVSRLHPTMISWCKCSHPASNPNATSWNVLGPTCRKRSASVPSTTQSRSTLPTTTSCWGASCSTARVGSTGVKGGCCGSFASAAIQVRRISCLPSTASSFGMNKEIWWQATWATRSAGYTSARQASTRTVLVAPVRFSWC